MASHNLGDDFSDDGFDTISSDALLELENNAIQYTQAQQPTGSIVAPSSDYGDEFEEDDLDDAVVVDESRSTPAVNKGFQSKKLSQSTHRVELQRPRSTDTLARRERPDGPPPPKFDRSSHTNAPRPVAQHESMLAEQGSLQMSAPDDQVETLRKQIEDLVKERNTLKDDVNIKAGEIAIVRRKQEKTAREFERDLVTVRKINEEKAAKLQRELEVARISEKKASTERDFYKLDAAEAERSRKLNKDRTVEKRDGENTLTPKKKKIFGHRDGFEDDEIDTLSPSKNSPSRVRRATSSPNKPGKRKRKTVDSPAGHLQVINLEEPATETSKESLIDEATLQKLSIQDDRFDFLGIMLDHRSSPKAVRTIEQLGQYRLPSSPTESVQSTILGRLPTLGFGKPVNELPVEFCNLIISLWSACLADVYLHPVQLFVGWLTLALELKTTSVAPQIIDSLVPLIQNTVDKVVVARCRNSIPPQPFGDLIDTTSCISLLYLIALGCMGEHQHIIRFWKYMRYDMTIMLLRPEQPIPDIELMIALLSTGVFRDRFGSPLGEDAQDQIIYTEMINLLTKYLVDEPNKSQSMESAGVNITYTLRLHVLQLMTSMTRSPFASRFIAMHQYAIGRIVKLISDELDLLYDYKPKREESARLISLATRLLYYYVTKYDDIKMQEKVSVIHGGSQKYLLCLARLNFSEDDLILESGIDPDVAALALEMLELSVTPEEGDAIHSAFLSQ